MPRAQAAKFENYVRESPACPSRGRFDLLSTCPGYAILHAATAARDKGIAALLANHELMRGSIVDPTAVRNILRTVGGPA